MNQMTRLVSSALLSLAGSFVYVAALHSQAEPLAFERADGKLPITVVLADGGGPPLIFRRATEPQNVIVINPSTDARQLSTAVFSLLVTEARDSTGRERSDNAVLRVNMPLSTPQYEHAAEAVSRLRNARARPVGSFGAALRAIEIWVAPRRGRRQ
jgi:hypothetical protein